MKKTKRILSLVLTLVMVLSTMAFTPVLADSAAGDINYTIDLESGLAGTSPTYLNSTNNSTKYSGDYSLMAKLYTGGSNYVRTTVINFDGENSPLPAGEYTVTFWMADPNGLLEGNDTFGKVTLMFPRKIQDYAASAADHGKFMHQELLEIGGNGVNGNVTTTGQTLNGWTQYKFDIALEEDAASMYFVLDQTQKATAADQALYFDYIEITGTPYDIDDGFNWPTVEGDWLISDPLYLNENVAFRARVKYTFNASFTFTGSEYAFDYAVKGIDPDEYDGICSFGKNVNEVTATVKRGTATGSSAPSEASGQQMLNSTTYDGSTLIQSISFAPRTCQFGTSNKTASDFWHGQRFIFTVTIDDQEVNYTIPTMIRVKGVLDTGFKAGDFRLSFLEGTGTFGSTLTIGGTSYTISGLEVAKISGKGNFVSLKDALAIAKTGDRVTLLKNVTEGDLTVGAGRILDVNDKALTVDALTVFGSLVDNGTSEGGKGGGAWVAANTISLPDTNKFIPIPDGTVNELTKYRFYKFDLKSLGTKEVGTDAVKYGYTIKFANTKAYARFAANNVDFEINFGLKVSGENIDINEDVSRAGFLNEWAAFAADSADVSRAAMVLTVSGFDAVNADDSIGEYSVTVTPKLVADSETIYWTSQAQ